MPHVLATLHGLEKDIVEDMLHEHTRHHALEGLHLEHIWENAEDDEEVIFLFKADDIEKAKTLLERVHQDAQRHNTEIAPPEIIYLKK